MASLNFTANTGGMVSCTGGAARTVLQIVAPANQRVRIVSWGVWFEGAAPQGTVRLLRQTTAGAMSAGTPVKLGTEAETIQTTVQVAATGEPTAGDILRRVHLQSGFMEIFPPGREIIVPGGGRLGIVVVTTATGNVKAQIDAEE